MLSEYMERIDGEKVCLVPVKVKPCPICGKYDGMYIQNSENYNRLYTENGGACLEMGCENCDLVMHVYDHNEKFGDYMYMRGALIAKWNRRA